MTQGTLDGHVHANDRVSAAAVQRYSVGQRTLIALSDGVFDVERAPSFISTPDHPEAAADALRREHGSARLPIGAFLVPGDAMTLIDCGIGPVDFQGHGLIVGGNLLRQLAVQGVQPEDVDHLALTHLHPDHIGWLIDSRGEVTFPNALVSVGEGDWSFYVEGDGGNMPLTPTIRATLLHLAEQGRVRLEHGEREISPGVTRIPAPGHTPGHAVFAIHDKDDRAVILGDALYCSDQFTQQDWEILSDFDPVQARRTREVIAESLESTGALGVGCHFPGLQAGRLIGSGWEPC